MRRFTTPILAALLLLLCASSDLVAQDQSEEIVSTDVVATDNPAQGILERIQSLPASSIERNLPRQRFETWLQRAMGTRAALTWNISDCGTPLGAEQNLSTPLPTCVEAEGALSDGRTVVIVLDASKMSEKTGTPIVHWISIEDKEGNVDVQSLKDLQRMLRMKNR
jgi:hypothetical protein